MADAGRIVKDVEVTEFCPNMTSVGIAEALIIQGVEDAVQTFCQRTFANTVYVNEEYSINVGAQIWDGIAVSLRRQFALKNCPIIAFASLKRVTARNAETGAVSSYETYTRNEYHVDVRTGIVTLLESAVTPPLLLSFPSGAASLLASYTAGYTYTTMPARLKLAVLQIVARIYQLQKRSAWVEDSLSGEFGTTQFKRVDLTEEERMMLRGLQRPALLF